MNGEKDNLPRYSQNLRDTARFEPPAEWMGVHIGKVPKNAVQMMGLAKAILADLNATEEIVNDAVKLIREAKTVREQHVDHLEYLHDALRFAGEFQARGFYSLFGNISQRVGEAKSAIMIASEVLADPCATDSMMDTAAGIICNLNDTIREEQLREQYQGGAGRG